LLSSNIVLTPERLAREVEIFGNEGEFVYDVETLPSAPGTDDRGVPSHNQVLWVGMSMHGRSIQIPMGHPIGTRVIGETKEPRADKNGKIRMFRVPVYERAPEQLDRGFVFEQLNPLFADPDIIKGAHGATFDNASVAKYRGGLIPAGKLACTLVMRWLTDENRKRYGLKYITKDVYKFAYDDEEVGRTVEKYPFGMVGHYLHCDVKYTWLEYVRNKRVIEEQGLRDLYELETDLVSVLARMRTNGVRIDVARLETLRDELAVRVEEIEGRVYSAAGRKFNLNAARQKQEVLFKPVEDGGQGLPAWKLTDGGRDKVEKQGLTPDHTFYSTDEESLDTFRGNRVVDSLLDYQESSKVLSTYVYGYLGVEDDKDKPNRIFDGMVYPDFVQYGAATGRFSCRNPNLQNVPAPRTDLGKMVRGLFIADPGWKLIVADYGQVELVILADLAYKLTGKKGALWHGFHEGIDPHTMTAAMVLGKDPSEVTKLERQHFGKSLNFAVVYGAGGTKVANMAGLEVTDADYRKGKARATSRLMRRYERQGLSARECNRRSNSETEIRAWLLWEKGQQLLNTYAEKFPEVGEARDITLKEARSHSLARTGFPPHSTTILGRLRRLPSLMSHDDGLRSYAERQAFNSRVQGSSADLTKMAMVRFDRVQEDHWKLLFTVHDELGITCPTSETDRARAALVESMTGSGIQELLTVPLTVDVAVVDRWSDAKD
jgi:DNA polymerase I-like protein with 3'-5' exonuclease and polymerase domains